MIYVLEGARNSGKTFLGKKLDDYFKIKRFQFDFVEYFNVLKLNSEKSYETHLFGLGKEYMLMQIARDIDIEFIHDRGIVSVLVWGLLENRITNDELKETISFVSEHGLLDNIKIFYVNGINPDKKLRNKDNWDKWEINGQERETYKYVINEIKKYNTNCIIEIENNFDKESIDNIINELKKIRICVE